MLKSILPLTILGLIAASCGSEPKCDAAMFGLDQNVDSVVYVNDGNGYTMHSVHFDSEGNIIAPADTRITRDDKGRITKYETNVSNPDSEDAVTYELKYGNDSFRPASYSAGSMAYVYETTLRYDEKGNLVSETQNGGFEGGGGEFVDEIDYQFLETDSKGNWTVRRANIDENFTEYDNHDRPINSRIKVSRQHHRRIYYR